MFFEKQRLSPSAQWTARQSRKVDGGLKQLAGWVGEDKAFFVDGRLTLADVAAGCVLGYLRVRFAEHPWQEMYPNLKRYSDRLEVRESFKKTVPVPQTIRDKIV
jgi:glutathione S-transferase